MKHFTLTLLTVILLFGQGALAQQWTWEAGSNTANVLSNYINEPGGLSSSATWMGDDGKLYMFGGQIFDPNYPKTNAFWSYDTLSHEWSFLGGSDQLNTPGFYGELGVASPTNYPGARMQSACWKDSNGDFWMFGGVGYGSASNGGYLNDLWRYQPSTGLWTWIGGSNQVDTYGVYGAQGVQSPLNWPGSRQLAAYWIKDDNLYLFGGNGRGASANGYLNDLWKYSIIDGQWVFLSGSGNASVLATHGTQHQPDVNNNPGSRVGGCFWASASEDILYFFGGTYNDGISSNFIYNDLWEYSISSNVWTWISGSNISGDTGISGELGVPSTEARPAARLTAIPFAQNNFLWLFGGYTTSYSNDFWRYSIATGEWTWMGGDVNPGNPGAYIEQGVPGNGNYPRNRESGFGWKSGSGTFWMYGGHGNVGGSMNDLWSLEVSPDAPATACTSLSGTLQQGLVGYWPFCGNANDESGNGNDGVVNGATLTEDRFGDVNSAYTFEGTDITIPIPNTTFQGDFTISVWAQLNTFSSDYPMFLQGENCYFDLGYINSNGYSNGQEGIGFAFSQGCAVGDWSGGVNRAVTSSNWSHITVIGKENLIYFYLDGVLVDLTETNVVNQSNTLGSYITIGRGIWSYQYFSGQVDDLAIYNRALTPDEVAALYGLELPQISECSNLISPLSEGLIGYWSLCGNANDVSGNENHGYAIGASPATDRFNNPEGALYFNNQLNYDKDWVKIPVDSGLVDGDYTISVWTKLNLNNSSLYPLPAAYPAIIEADQCYLTTIYDLYSAEDGVYGYYEAGSCSSSPSGPGWSALINPEEWGHLVIMSVNDSTSFYVNGVHIITVQSPNQSLGIGRFLKLGRGHVSQDLSIFNGWLDDLAIYNRALTTAEITSLYTGEPVVQPACAQLDPALQNGLVGYWPFCGNANDESGNGNDGVVNGATLTEDRFGNMDRAYSFDGLDDIISLPNESNVQGNAARTVSAWFKLNSNFADGAIYNGGTNGDGNDFTVWIYSIGNQNEFVVHLRRYFQDVISDTIFIEFNSWHNVVISYDGSTNDNIKFYLDSILISSTLTGLGGQTFNTPAVSPLIGNYLDQNNNNHFFNGSLDDIGIWNRALTPEEITSLYTGEPVVQPACAQLDPALQNGLVGYWPFCGNANDESGNGNDGVVNGATLTEDRFGNAGSAYYFDGNYDVITNPELDSVNLTLFEGLSMSVWFNTDTLNLPQRLIHFFDGQYDLSIHYSPADQKLLFVNWDAAAGENYRFEIAINENEWIHAVWALDFANNISTAFINGVMVNTPTNIPTQTGPNSTLRIGNDFNLNGWPFFGSLDDIGIWNRALTPEEITSLYTGEPVVQPACAQLDPALQNGLVGYWPFCGNANDESGNGNDGMVNGATLTEDRFGNSSSAYYFSGGPNADADDIQFSNPLVSNEDFSLCYWMDSQLSGTHHIDIVGSTGIGFELISHESSTIWFRNWNAPAQSAPLDFIVDLNTELSDINHICLTYNHQQVSLFSNGQLDSTINFNSLIIPEGGFMLVGRHPYFDNNAYTAHLGTLDDIGIWNRALTPEEITSLYTGEPVVQPACAQLDPALQNGLVGYWPFCGNANDESGNGNDGVVNGATLTEDRFGVSGQAFYFNGQEDRIEIGNSSSLSPTSLSISAWIKVPSSNIANGYTSLIAKWWQGLSCENNSDSYLLYIDNSVNSIIGASQYNTSSPTFLSSDVNSIETDQWYHLTFIHDELDGQLLYLNGNLIASNGISGALCPTTNNLFFGCDNNQGTLWRFFNGFLDDIGIWNRALTAEEIALLYGNFTPQVTGCTDPLAFNYNPEANVNEGCQYTATILVYNDLNGNGEHEADEPGLSNWPVLGNDINGLVWTNANGNVFLPLAAGQYEFTVLNPTDNWISTTPTSSIASLGSSCTDQAGNPTTCPSSLSIVSFGLQVIPGEAIVAVGPYQGFADIIHCTDGYESGVYLENIGSQTVSGFMTLSCDPLFTPGADSYFTTPPIETGPGYALWNIEDFLPGEYELLTFHIDGPGVEYLNQSFTFDFDLTLLDPQGNMIYNDGWSVTPIVACAYDPNDLTGYPEDLTAPHEEGYTIEHFIHDDHVVEFRVRFQNTGTLPAEDIDIYIPIDPNVWELNSIEPLMRVADMQTICLHDDGSVDLNILEHELPEGVVAEDLLIFSFDDIFLPDSASNPEGSQGYVWFQMKAKHGLDPATELNAQAFIYFEQNPPITTNETYHVIFDCTSFTPMTGDAELCADEDLLFSASQPYVDEYAWSLNGLEGSNNIFIYEGIEPGNYTLQLNTSNVLCPQGENHEVNITVHELPTLDLPFDATVCEGESITFEANSDSNVSWSNGANTGDSIEATESFTVTATSVGAGGCSVSEDWSVTVNPLPSAAVENTNNVLTAQDGTSWQWSVNGVDGATTQSITAAVDGNYQVLVTNEFGCAAESDVIVIDITNSVVDYTRPTLALYPNPMKDQARLELPKGTCDIALYDATGACVRSLNNQQGWVTIERESLASGVYQVRINQGDLSTNVRLVIE